MMKQPSHPGAIVRNMIEELGMSVTAAAEALAVHRQTLNNLVNLKNGVSPDMAIRLEAVFGSTADNWLRLQAAHDLARAREHETEITRGLRRVEAA